MHKPLTRQSQRLSLADALSSQKRRVSHFFLRLAPFSEPNNEASVQANARTLTPWQAEAAAPQISHAAEFLIGRIPLTSLTQGSRIDIEEAGKARGPCTAAGLLL